MKTVEKILLMYKTPDIDSLQSFLYLLFYTGSWPNTKKSGGLDFYLEHFQEEMCLHSMSSKPYPAKLYKAIKDFFQVTNAEYKEIMGHTWKTVQTRKNEELLNQEYSEKLVSAAKVWTLGIAFFGTEKKFNHWLRQFNPFLDNKPIDLLTTINGSEIVSEELERLYDGSLA
jgi:putative toxin-antitoxin system antitoxin component (TIGR02293 family)